MLLLIAIVLYGVEGFAAKKGDEKIYHGPSQECTYESPDYIFKKIQFEIHETLSFKGPAEEILFSYNFPELNKQIELKNTYRTSVNMSLKEENEDDDKAIYFGKISNIDYLVDATLNLEDNTLSWTEDEELVKFTGTCKKVNHSSKESK